MIGKKSLQISILDGAFNHRTKQSRTDQLLKQINEFVNWNKLVDTCKVVFKDSKRGRPTTPIEFTIKCLFLQYLYNLSDPGLEDALIDRLKDTSQETLFSVEVSNQRSFLQLVPSS